jgi:hypothetical protein
VRGTDKDDDILIGGDTSFEGEAVSFKYCWQSELAKGSATVGRSEARYAIMTPEQMQSFRETLANANRVVALCGAGLSAASGLGVRPPHQIPLPR